MQTRSSIHSNLFIRKDTKNKAVLQVLQQGWAVISEFILNSVMYTEQFKHAKENILYIIIYHSIKENSSL